MNGVAISPELGAAIAAVRLAVIISRILYLAAWLPFWVAVAIYDVIKVMISIALHGLFYDVEGSDLFR